MSGAMDVVIAGGVESMTRVPMFSNAVLAQKAGMGYYVSPAMQQRYPDIEFSQFIGAEMMAKKYGLSKVQLDQFALERTQRAIAATKAGAFNEEIMPLEVRRLAGAPAGEVHTDAEGIRFSAHLTTGDRDKHTRE